MSTQRDIDFFDETRRRVIPVRLWQPDQTPTLAWILFSVGFGGDRSGYAYLARSWAAGGIATAVIEHVGSNLDVLKNLPGKTRSERNREVVRRVADPMELSARPRDLLFVHSQLASSFAGKPLGVAGHSYGTYTVFAGLGLPTVPRIRPLERSLLTAVSSCLVISPQPPGMLFSPRALGGLNVPTLVLTGTKDGPLDGEGDYHDRVRVYDHLPVSQRNLAVLEGVEHMGFAGIGLRLGPQLATIKGLTGRWWQSSMGQSESSPGQRAQELASMVLEDPVKGAYR